MAQWPVNLSVEILTLYVEYIKDLLPLNHNHFEKIIFWGLIAKYVHNKKLLVIFTSLYYFMGYKILYINLIDRSTKNNHVIDINFVLCTYCLLAIRLLQKSKTELKSHIPVIDIFLSLYPQEKMHYISNRVCSQTSYVLVLIIAI